MTDETKRLESELASERAKSAGLKFEIERYKEEASRVFDRLKAERDMAVSEARRLKKKHEPEPPPEPNLPPITEPN